MCLHLTFMNLSNTYLNITRTHMHCTCMSALSITTRSAPLSMQSSLPLSQLPDSTERKKQAQLNILHPSGQEHSVIENNKTLNIR